MIEACSVAASRATDRQNRQTAAAPLPAGGGGDCAQWLAREARRRWPILDVHDVKQRRSKFLVAAGRAGVHSRVHPGDDDRARSRA
jgi:hypothetical protein